MCFNMVLIYKLYKNVILRMTLQNKKNIHYDKFQ